MKFDPATKLQQSVNLSANDGVNPAISDSATFAFSKTELMSDTFEGKTEGCFLYSRHWNPTNQVLSSCLAAMEGTEAGWVTCSGMAAITSAILQICNSGDEDGDGEVDPCLDTHTQVGPLLFTEWWQGGAFNDSIPVDGCIGGEQALVGCVAVSAAQVMRFYEYPDNYNWANMPNFIGTSETARLIKDIGHAVDMNWTCEGSSAYTADLPSVLKEDFGYMSANYSDFNRNTVTYELNNGRPVILRGQCTGGHAWVCDGYLRSTYCDSGASYLSLSMNWGWEFGEYNGFYAYNGWTPGNSNYNTFPHMITYIIP